MDVGTIVTVAVVGVCFAGWTLIRWQQNNLKHENELEHARTVEKAWEQQRKRDEIAEKVERSGLEWLDMRRSEAVQRRERIVARAKLAARCIRSHGLCGGAK